MRERDIEDYLVDRVKAMGGEVRKVRWVGRRAAPDRLVMLPARQVHTGGGCFNAKPATAWVELKRPGKLATFPADERERAQAREHSRMRKLGQIVLVIDSLEGVEELLG